MEKRAETPEEKKAILDRLERVWLAHPHLRLGQLLANMGPGVRPNPDLYYAEDEDLIQFLEGVKTPIRSTPQE